MSKTLFISKLTLELFSYISSENRILLGLSVIIFHLANIIIDINSRLSMIREIISI